VGELIEDIGLILKGVVLGLAIAAPVGPIGLLCIRRTVERGVLAGFATGFGAGLVDTLFSAIAAFGITAVTDLILGHEMFLKLAGGLFLLATAAYGLTHTPRPPRKTVEASSLARAVVSGFVLTITNPITIVAILAVVAGFGGALRPSHALALVAGIFVGSTLWWALLSGSVSLLRRRMGERMVLYLNRGTSVALGALGLWALGSASYAALVARV
jgi:threonine/homoserine/homoserine lactone efflux protein